MAVPSKEKKVKKSNYTGLEIAVPSSEEAKKKLKRKANNEKEKKEFYAGVEHLSKYEYPEALQCFKNYLDTIIETHGEDCNKAIFVRESIGAVAVKMEHWNEAKHHYNIALNFIKIKLTDSNSNSSSTISTQYKQILDRSIDMYLNIKEYDNAIDCLEDIIEIMTAGHVREILYFIKKLIEIKEQIAIQEENEIQCIEYFGACLQTMEELSYQTYNRDEEEETKHFLDENYFRIGFIIVEAHCQMNNVISAKKTLFDLLQKYDFTDETQNQHYTLPPKQGYAEKQVILLKKLANILENENLTENAILRYKQALTISGIMYGKDDPKLLDDLLHLGFLNYQHGHHDQALDYFEESVSIVNFSTGVITKNSPTYFQALQTLLQIYISKQNFDAACSCLQQLVKVARRLHGNTTIETAAILHQLGYIEFELGKKSQGISTLENALAIKRTISTNNPNDLSLTLRHLGRMQADLGMKKKALKYYEEALITTDETEKLQILCDLALVQFKLHKTKEAFISFEKALCLVAKNDKVCMSIFINMGNMYQETQDDDNALLYYRKALALATTFSEENDQDELVIDARIQICYNTGLIYVKQKRYADSLGMFHEILRIKVPDFTNKGGETKLSKEIAAVMNVIGNVYSQKKRYNEALEWHQESLLWKEKVYGQNNELIMGTLSNLGSTYYHLKDYSGAMKCYKRALSLPLACSKSAETDATSVEFASLLDSIGSVYLKKKRYDRAMKYYRRALGMKKAILHDEEMDEILQTKLNMAYCFSKEGKYNQAEPILDLIYNIKLKKHGVDSPEVTKLLLDLSSIHLYMSDLERATAIFQLAQPYLNTLRPNDSLTKQATWFQKRLSKAKIGFHVKLEKVIEESSNLEEIEEYDDEEEYPSMSLSVDNYV